MTKTGPIIVIEDDIDDQEILSEIFQNLKLINEIIFFSDGDAAIEYLSRDNIAPFIILSDINMPKINGFELRKIITTNAKLHIKCIPYLFFTTGVSKKAVLDAYAMSVQGFFKKSNNIRELENTIRKIVEYWEECFAPGLEDLESLPHV